MSIYAKISKIYDILDVTYFADKEKSPRVIIEKLIPDDNLMVLDLCCGTMSNSITIASRKKNISVLGVDISKQMLEVAKEKIRSNNLDNVSILCANATNTSLKDNIADYIIIGLVLHEMSPVLQHKILAEAHRLLKHNGTLIVLEWEKQKSFIKKLLLAPLLATEQVSNRTFSDFLKCDKPEFFKKNGFEIKETYHSSYSVVMTMKKR